MTAVLRARLGLVAASTSPSQQLQVLRDRGWLEFAGKGRYRLRAVV